MRVPNQLYYASAVVQANRGLLKRLAALETWALQDELADVTIQSPIYIAGVARSGSTILLEMLNQHPQLTSHRYSDFPNIYTPYWRNWLHQKTRGREQQRQERSHRDRIQVNENSPEAIEEVLWMNFFTHCHRTTQSQILTQNTENPPFEAFYQDHIRKLLLVRQRSRYLAKGNYNFTRLAYIHKLFSDACFLLPVRHPLQHLSSLLKQDRLFHESLQNNPHAENYLRWVGHYEFGPHQHMIHVGNQALADEMNTARQNGNQLKAWALQWNSLYQFVLDQLDAQDQLASRCLWVPYENLCRDSAEMIERILDHCNLPVAGFEKTKRHYTELLTEPSYYEVGFSPAEQQQIIDICGATANRMGYQV